MEEIARPNDSTEKSVAVTLQLDADVYQSFLSKAEKAGVDLESYLSRTLSIVLGCRVFNETIVCSPQIAKTAIPIDGFSPAKRVETV